jgi:ketosteroid isomerase-like protein
MDTSTEIAAVRDAYIAAFNAGNLDALMELHTAAAIHLPSGGPPVVGPAEVRALMRASLEHTPPGFQFHCEPVGLRVVADLAVEWGVTPGAPGFPGGKYLLVYERDAGGRWRIAWTMSNFDGPPGGGT